jgi:hexosaminidase
MVSGCLRLQAQNVSIIPCPREMKTGQRFFTIRPDVKIVYSTQGKNTALILQNYLKRISGFLPELIESEKYGEGVIQFRFDKSFAKEQYDLIVTDKGAQIVASNNTGWYYGLQTLLQLLPSFMDSTVQFSSVHIPEVTIRDSPRFSWRAFLLDEARYFKGIDQVKMLLDEMALLKMNIFQWHLVDDQGWRIEIKKYPLLTEIGSKRKSSQIGPLKWGSPIQSAEPHEGFYTQEEIKEIVNYAKERHITIVPEIEMPGHSTAAIASYSWLGTTKEKIDMPIRFESKDVYDISDPKVIRFLTDVLDEIMDLFPSEVIHIGGDEVNYKHWKESKSVQAYMKANNLATPGELQMSFTNYISQYLQSKGRRMMGWNEIMGQSLHDYQDESDARSDQQLAKESIVHFWKGDVALATQAASSGYDIVNSLHTETYLDYDYNSIPLSRAYAFDPVPAELDPKYHSNVIGLGCQMWGEWIPTRGNMHFMVFPRIAAYAEVGWTEMKNKDFDNFKQALQKFQKHWTQKEIYFAGDDVVEGDVKR